MAREISLVQAVNSILSHCRFQLLTPRQSTLEQLYVNHLVYIYIYSYCIIAWPHDTTPCGLFSASVYCFYSHLSLLVEMVIRCFFSFFVYVCNVVLYYIVCIFILISFFGLHSFVEMCASGMISGGGIYLVFLFCFGESLAFIMFL